MSLRIPVSGNILVPLRLLLISVLCAVDIGASAVSLSTSLRGLSLLKKHVRHRSEGGSGWAYEEEGAEDESEEEATEDVEADEDAAAVENEEEGEVDADSDYNAAEEESTADDSDEITVDEDAVEESDVDESIALVEELLQDDGEDSEDSEDGEDGEDSEDGEGSVDAKHKHKHKLKPSEETMGCFDIQPPAEWRHHTCISQVEQTSTCEERKNGTRHDGFCAKTCGLCTSMIQTNGRPPTMLDLQSLHSWCEKGPYHIEYGKVAYKMSFKEGSEMEDVENVTSIYHLHTPKVAGVSFAKDLSDLLPGGFRLDSHEGCYDDVPNPELGVVLMMRNPRQHVYSQYNFCATSPDKGPSRMHQLMPPTFQEWIHHWTRIHKRGHAVGDFTTGPDTPYNDPWCFSTLPFACYSPVNLQAQRLTCKKAYDYAEKVDMRYAIGNLDDAFFVGIVEAYQESICLLHFKMHGSGLPEWCACDKPEAWKSAPVHQDDHGAHHDGMQNIPQEVLDEVDSLTVADRALYNLALDRFTAEVRDAEVATGMKIMCKDLKKEAEE